MVLDTSGNPFVGLRPFESHESLLFFGRQEQTLQLLQRLHEHHFVAVIGNSGSGKSSLVKAGLIPSLQAGYLINDADNWLVASMRPGQTPLCNLSTAILNQTNQGKDGLDSTSLEKKIKEQGIDIILEILLPLWKKNTNFFLLVDQFEELFRFSLDNKEVEKQDEAIYFVDTLLELSMQTDIPVYVVLTMRSDFIGDCAKFYGLPEAMNKSQFIVPRLNRVQLKTTIEGPVKLYKERISPSLTAKLLNDVQVVKDELPLLQHILMRIWDREIVAGRESELDLSGYEIVGGIEKALSLHADEALQNLSSAELDMTKKVFQALTAIDENGRKIRRPVRLSELAIITRADTGALLRLLNRFIEDKRSFLFISKVEGRDDMLVDISHESLIRQWRTLNEWVDEEAVSGEKFLRLTEAARLHNENSKDFLTGNELSQLLEWFNTFKPTAVWAKRYSPAFENSIHYLLKSELEWKAIIKEKDRQRFRKLRNLWLLSILAGVLVIAFGLLTYVINKKSIQINNQLARYYLHNNPEDSEKNSMLGLQLIAEAIASSADKDLSRNLLIYTQPLLPHVILDNIFPHSNPVYKVSFSKDGNKVLTASYDNTARLWDVHTGKQIGSAMTHKDAVTSAVFSNDEKMVLTASDDGTARLWNAATGAQIGASLQHEGPVRGVSFSGDGKWILTASSDNTARIWDVATQHEVGPAMKHEGKVYNAVFRHDGMKVLTISSDNAVRIWDTKTRELDGPSIPHPGIVYTAVFSPDEKMILTACEDGAARLWNVATRAESVPAMKHDAIVKFAVFNADGSRILTGGDDSTARVWDASSGNQVGSSMRLDNKVISAVFSPDEKTILTASYDRTARLWDAKTQKQSGPSLLHQSIVYDAVFNGLGTGILTACGDGTARLWSVVNVKKVDNKVIHLNSEVSSAAFSPDGNKIVAAGYDGTASVLSALTGEHIGPLLRHDSLIVSACFSPDGKTILTASSDGTARIWDALTMKQLISVREKAELKHAVFSPDGNRFLTVCGPRATEYNVATGERVSFFSMGNDSIVSSAVYSADGQKVLVVNYGSVILFDEKKPASFHSYGQLGNVKYKVNKAVLNADGSKILTTASDRTACQWYVTTGAQTGAAMKHQGIVNEAVFDASGKLILTACGDSTARLWETLFNYQIGRPMAHNSAVNSAAFSPNGRKIVTAGNDSTVRIWDIEGDMDMSPGLFKLQAQAISGAELNIETSEVRYLARDEWLKRKNQYEKQAMEHYRVCQYREFNFWKNFHEDEAMKSTSKDLKQ